MFSELQNHHIYGIYGGFVPYFHNACENIYRHVVGRTCCQMYRTAQGYNIGKFPHLHRIKIVIGFDTTEPYDARELHQGYNV